MPGPTRATVLLLLLACPALPRLHAPLPGRLVQLRQERTASQALCALLTEQAGLPAFRHEDGVCRMGRWEEEQEAVGEVVWTGENLISILSVCLIEIQFRTFASAGPAVR